MWDLSVAPPALGAWSLSSEVLFFFFLDFVFNVGHFKIFIEFLTILLLFHVLVFWSQGMWDLSFLTKD